jgi:hypothetical protein
MFLLYSDYVCQHTHNCFPFQQNRPLIASSQLQSSTMHKTLAVDGAAHLTQTSTGNSAPKYFPQIIRNILAL